ncbi:hypothetical protein, partial [Angustibacter peucedani]
MGAERHRRTKTEWRRDVRARRRALDPGAVADDGRRLAALVLALPELAGGAPGGAPGGAVVAA